MQRRELAIATMLFSATFANAATYNSTTDSSWFTLSNWSGDPTAQVNSIRGGQGYSNLIPSGVVFDAVNDPNAGVNAAFATIQRIYIADTNNSTGKLTIKSGTLTATSFNRVGRSVGAEGTLVIDGGTFTGADNVDVATDNSSASGFATGIIDFRSGTMNFNAAGRGIRLGLGNADAVNSVKGGQGTLIVRNSGSGSITVNSLQLGVSSAGSSGTLEYHYTQGHSNYITVTGNSLNLNTAAGSTGASARYAQLALVLDESPLSQGDDGNGNVKPVDIPLIDLPDTETFTPVSFNQFSLAGDSSVNPLTALPEGSVVSASFGGFTYNYTLTYAGTIAGSAGHDVVLLGLSSNQAIPEPTSLALAGAALSLLGRRRRR